MIAGVLRILVGRDMRRPASWIALAIGGLAGRCVAVADPHPWAIGPVLVLPVLAVDDLDAAIGLINRRPRPLALYLFCRRDSARRQILRQTSSGTVAFNDVVLQVMVPDLPFGGVGASGFGSHHGQAGFTTFSHQRSVLRRPFLLDWPVRYPPYRGKLPLVKRLLG